MTRERLFRGGPGEEETRRRGEGRSAPLTDETVRDTARRQGRGRWIDADGTHSETDPSSLVRHIEGGIMTDRGGHLNLSPSCY